VRGLIREILLPLSLAIGFAFAVQASVAKPYEIPTGSMLPTIQKNDRIIANRLIYRFRDIERGDIIVFNPPPSATRSCNVTGDIPFVKRVIGLPGDEVVVHENGPTVVNGTPLIVDEALPNPPQLGGRAARTFKVPPGRIFVLGDNRPGSCDSHEWMPDPFVPENNVIGQAEIVYWPLGHLGFLD
jgi:signal peptidase I